jgi:deoxycytidylate deaminase
MTNLSLSDQPELVFGLVGPIGVDMDAVQAELERALRHVSYQPHIIHLTKKVAESFPYLDSVPASNSTQKIAMVNRLRTDTGRNDILAQLAILHIGAIRDKVNGPATDVTDQQRPRSPIPANAFIIRQLKREEEISLLKKIYGRRFIQLSVTISESKQLQSVTQTIAKTNPSFDHEKQKSEAIELIGTDQKEKGDKFGQRLSDTFHSGDVFVDGSTDESLKLDIGRFIDALFGKNSISPTIDEFGSYMAKAASLRSIDMSRQVGAAILSDLGDIITIGCNEVPKPHGGNYWCSDDSPQRDMDRKIDANKLETSRIIRNFIDSIEKHGSLKITTEELLADMSFQELLKDSLISDITEFGRMTHAEMAALSDAARLGRSVQGATIYVTTYPCHNCAKHLIAAGIKRIVYIEPYPKSRAIILHDDALSHELNRPEKVALTHFHGISPRRYRDIFEKTKRKDKDNVAKTWYEGTAKPLVGDRFSSHVLFEGPVLDDLVKIIDQLKAH